MEIGGYRYRCGQDSKENILVVRGDGICSDVDVDVGAAVMLRY